MSNLNEGQTQVYMNGAILPQYGIDTTAPYLNRPPQQLLDLIREFYRSGKSDGQVLAILVGMGTEQQLALSGINYFKASLVVPTTEKVTQNNHTKMNFTLTDLYENISKAVEGLNEMNKDSSKISFSAKQVAVVLENALASFPGVRLKNGKLVTKFDKTSYHEIKEDVAQHGGPLASMISFKEFNQEEFNNLKAAFESQINPTAKYQIAKNIYRDISQNAWLNPVNELKSYIDKIYENSKWSFKISESIDAFGKKGNPLYEKLSNELVQVLNESDVISAFRNVARNNKWSLECSSILSEINESEKVAGNQSTARVNKLLTPVLESTNGMIFNLHGKNYLLNDNQISEATVNDFRFNTIVETLTFAIIGENTVTFYGDNNSFLEYNMNEGTLMLGDINLSESSILEIRNAMISTKFYDARNINKIDKICITLEHAEIIAEMDQALALQSNEWLGLFLTMIAVEEGVWVNKINTGMQLNEMKFFTSATEAVSEAKSFIGYDATTYLSERLQAEGNTKAIAERLRNNINAKISTLEEKKNDVLAAVKQLGECTEFTEALSIIECELATLEKELQETYILEKKTQQQYLNDGYVEAKLSKDIDSKFKKGMNIMINAEEYSALGNDELIDIIDPKTGESRNIPRDKVSVEI
jgi:hypothetical protein